MNKYELAAENPSQETNLAAVGTTSDLARRMAKNVLKENGRITQTERLFTTRARYAREDNLYSSDGQDLGGGRGDWSYIKLLTSKVQEQEYKNGTTKRDLTYKDLVTPGDSIGLELAGTDGYSNFGYDRFLLTGVSCDMNEKVQISEVFGDGEVVYYFGRQPLMFNLRGILIDSVDNDWFVDWIKTYSEFLRGSQTARNYELIKIVLPNMSITGTVAGFSFNQDSSRDTDIAFSMQFIAKIVEPKLLDLTANNSVINSPYLKGVDFSAINGFASTAQINSLKGQVASLTGVISNPNSSLRAKGAALGKLGTGIGGGFGAFLEDSKDTINGARSSIEGWNSEVSTFAGNVKTSALFQTVTSALNGIRTNLFSPIYGVLSSLTKLVSNAFNSVNSIFNSLINPVRNILRDITNISKQAIALVNLVNSSIKGVGRNVNSQLRGLSSDFKIAIKTLGKAAGTIAAAPISAANSARDMFSSGTLSSQSAFLSSTPKLTFVRPSLTVLRKPVPTKLSLLTGTAEYTAKTSNSL